MAWAGRITSAIFAIFYLLLRSQVRVGEHEVVRAGKGTLAVIGILEIENEGILNFYKLENGTNMFLNLVPKSGAAAYTCDK